MKDNSTDKKPITRTQQFDVAVDIPEKLSTLSSHIQSNVKTKTIPNFIDGLNKFVNDKKNSKNENKIVDSG